MTFDPTISFGTVLTILTMLMGLVGIAYKHGVAMALLASSHNELTNDVKGIKSDVHDLGVRMIEVAVVQQRLADGAARMDRMQADINQMQQSFRRKDATQ